jgi:hypothetical protein
MDKARKATAAATLAATLAATDAVLKEYRE